MFRESIVVMDCETASLQSNWNSILTIAFCTITKEGKIVNPLGLAIKYDNYDHVDPAALAVNGIDLVEHDKTATPWAEAQETVNNYIRDACYEDGKLHMARFLAHNASFDIDHLSKFQTNFNEISFRGARIDSQALLNDLYVRGISQCRSVKLQKACDFYGIEIKNHDALSDTLACAKLYLKLISLEEEFYKTK